MLSPEELEQKAVIEWSKMYDSLRWLHAVPNGAHLAGDKNRRAMQMNKLKGQGLKTGVADLFLPMASGDHHGLYIEMKRPDGKGKQTDDQKAFQKYCDEQNYLYRLCDNAGTAICTIQTYVRMK